MNNSDKPVALGLAPSFGFGDRLGLATPGHVAALKRCGGGILPIFPQQSIREMTRTGRSATQVMSDAVAGARASGYAGPFGADADHLKTTDDIELTARAGFVFFTLDPSGDVNPLADTMDDQQRASAYRAVADCAAWAEGYVGRTVMLSPAVTIHFDRPSVERAAIKYGRAIATAIRLGRHVERVATELSQPFEIELSVDETPTPTTAVEHFIIAEQCQRGGVRLTSLAPRFIGEFEKGVDFKGDPDAFSRSLVDHATIAEALGPYKLSLHSGSDKLSIYGQFAKATRGRFHVKTAGTSYLEAVRVVARHDAAMFRRLVEFARERYEVDRQTYHVSATLASAPSPSEVPDVSELEELYLGRWDQVPAGVGFTQPGRQILHCTFGSVLTDPVFGPQVKQLVREHRETYDSLLDDHFGRHLEALRSGM